MSNKIIAYLLAALFLAPGTALAGADLDLSCPSSVKVGAALNVTVKPYNHDKSSLTLSRYMAGIIANTSDSVGNAGLYGPFARTLATSKSVPAINQTSWTAGTVTAFTVPVIAKAPNAPNKMAMVFLSFITNTGHDIAGASCLVNIVP